MNKHLNNWLDKIEGKKEGSSNRGIEKEMKRQGYKKQVAKKMKSNKKWDLVSHHMSDAEMKAKGIKPNAIKEYEND